MADRAAPRIERVGDAALLLTLGDEVDLSVSALARRVASRLKDTSRDVVQGHSSVLVPFDPDIDDEATVRVRIEAALDGAGADADDPVAGVLHEIFVAYGGDDGADLAEVAARTGLSEADVVRLHAGVTYRVLAIGFVPGFGYLGVLPPELELPRRATPRVRVPPGSVAIVGRQTCVYPFATPGGWHLIGRTDTRLWDPVGASPALLAPGDRVRFVPG